MPRLLTALLVLLAAPSALAQGAVTGRVVDASTGEPLPGVHVYLSGTTTGAVTDPGGDYRILGVPAGPHELVATMIGYVPGVHALRVGASPQTVDFRVSPRTEQLGGVTASADRSDWLGSYERFERALVGRSRAARSVRVANPEVVAFERAEDGLLRARSEAPLRIENHALGFVVEYDLSQFEMLGDDVAFLGYARFEPMAPRDDRQRRDWTEARERAYAGSFAHFVHALASGRLRGEGFRVYRTNVRHRLTPAQATGANALDAVSDPASVLQVVMAGVIGSLTADPAFYLRVDYVREREDRAYKWTEAAAADARFARDAGHQVSWIETPEGGVRIDLRSGQIGGGAGVRPLLVSGYWAWDERAAHWLPADYRPPSD